MSVLTANHRLPKELLYTDSEYGAYTGAGDLIAQSLVQVIGFVVGDASKRLVCALGAHFEVVNVRGQRECNHLMRRRD
jgi:hypothetical protein